jgi:hypothetical protein
MLSSRTWVTRPNEVNEPRPRYQGAQTQIQQRCWAAFCSSSPYNSCDNFMEFVHRSVCIKSTPCVVPWLAQENHKWLQGLCSSTTSDSRAFVDRSCGLFGCVIPRKGILMAYIMMLMGQYCRVEFPKKEILMAYIINFLMPENPNKSK